MANSRQPNGSTDSWQHAEAGEASACARTIVLVGLMGAGKTAVGRLLAERLHLPFVDADREIEAAAGLSITEIFARHGEPFFREREEKVIARLLSGPPQVIAAGGGAFMSEATRKRIKACGVSVWLKAGIDLLIKRTAKRSHRPLLAGENPRAVLERLAAEREPIYASADVVVETTDEPAEAVAGRVATSLAEHLARAPHAAAPRSGTAGAPG